MKIISVIWCALLYVSVCFAGDTWKIYIDADRTGARSSGIAIERGVKTALNRFDNKLAGRNVEVVLLDHRGNTRRSLAHMKKFLADPDALVVFSGLHSPPLLANKQFINDNRILVLDPWAAAGPITRGVGRDGKNWIFRLSVDDSKAGEVIIRQACDFDGHMRPALLLEDTGWGKSNHQNMSAALQSRGLDIAEIIFFNWNVKTIGAKQILADIISANADVVIFVGNAPEGKTFLQAMGSLPAKDRLPIISHWGITGGNFFQTLGADLLTRDIDLKFLQTRFSFLDPERYPAGTEVFNQAKELFSSLDTPHDLHASTGFVHAYDLTLLLMQAANQSTLTDSMPDNRRVLQNALEHLNSEVRGLLKTYRKPFSPYTVAEPDAHEALGIDDLCFGKYDQHGGVRLELPLATDNNGVDTK